MLPLCEWGLPGVDRLVRDPVWLLPSIPRPPVNFLVLWWLYLNGIINDWWDILFYKYLLLKFNPKHVLLMIKVHFVEIYILIYLSEEDPLASRLWSGVRLVLEWAELGVGGPPYLLELPTGVERPPYIPLLRTPLSTLPLLGASTAYGSPLI